MLCACVHRCQIYMYISVCGHRAPLHFNLVRNQSQQNACVHPTTYIARDIRLPPVPDPAYTKRVCVFPLCTRPSCVCMFGLRASPFTKHPQQKQQQPERHTTRPTVKLLKLRRARLHKGLNVTPIYLVVLVGERACGTRARGYSLYGRV